MSFIEIILLLIVAALTGSIGKAISGYSHGGCIVNIVVGFIGALIGTWIARQMKLPELFVLDIGNKSFPVIWAIIGAVVFTSVLGILSSRKS
ncbi:MAG: GlsB/YeaQ/YmgE family stress response membrane protein [Ignavibacteriaceae bacterium]|nr:GlsB/YeaQ/YmgE family stress response membrane protein [Ignavibacteriaceae bacterium]